CKVQIVVENAEPEPIKVAVQALCKDFQKLMNVTPIVLNTIPTNSTDPVIVIVNRGNKSPSLFLQSPPLDGFESHRVYADSNRKIIFLDGADMRGAIYAIYTFSEKILGVPPLWYWNSWVPKQKK